MLPVAIQLYSLRDDAERDIVSTLKAVKDYGYDGVEFAGFCGKTPEELGRIVKEIGLIPISAHISLYDLRADAEKVINDYKTIGCRHLVVPGLAAEDRPGNGGWEKVKEDLDRFGAMIREAGMTLSYHNHDFEFVRLENGEYGFDDLYASTKPENVKMQQDSCWVSVAGESPVAYLERYADRCPLLHLKDYVGRKSENMYALIGIDESKKEASPTFEFRPVGYGVQDFGSIIEAAEKCGVEWLIVEQDEPSMDKTRMECAEMSIKYLRNM